MKPPTRRTLPITALALLPLLLAACAKTTHAPAPSATAGTTPAATTTAVASTPAPIPADYSAMYQSLSSSLDGWQRTLDAQPPVQGAAPAVFGAHVLAANGNRGAALLDPSTMPLVDKTLDRLKELGVGGVTLSVSFPLLNAGYPRAADYLTFYETVAQHVRDRGLKLSVEQHIVFTGTAFSSVQFDFGKLPFDQFEAQFHAMAQTVIDHLHPDYLTLLSEPDTFVRLTGYRQASTPAGAAAMIDAVTAGLNRGTTKVGAGAGSWLPDAAAYARAFAASSLDYVDLHIYPIGGTALTNAQAVVDAAHAAGKPVVLDEVWLYKMGAGEAAAQTWAQTTQIFLRDNYSFWSPLDARFLVLVAKFARKDGIAYVAPFWTTFFWGNVDYSTATKDLGYTQLSQQANRAVVQALQQGTFTPLGEAWAAAIR